MPDTGIANAAPWPPPARPSVLLVDDNEANLTALTALLSPLDVDITQARSGDQALAQLLAQDFAVILMDVRMPGIDGLETTKLIRQRERTRHVPIIFLTASNGDGDIESVRAAYELGALDYLIKPFEERFLRAKVEAIAEQQRQTQLIAQQAAALRIKEVEAERERAARAAAVSANRAKDDFLRMISHELRAPLNGILGWGRLLESEHLSARGERAIAAIVEQAKKQCQLIDNLLDVSLTLFEPFRQASSGINRSYGGLGLGLALARALIHLHRGRIDARSEGRGKGATFEIILPASETVARPADDAREPSAPSPPSRSALPLQERRVLLVDDEEGARELTSVILAEAGARVTVASSAADALARIAESTFDILVSDIGMPEQDGLTLIRQIRARELAAGGSRLPAVAVSGYTSNADRNAALEAGFQAHVGKPCDPIRLVDVLVTLPASLDGDQADSIDDPLLER